MNKKIKLASILLGIFLVLFTAVGINFNYNAVIADAENTKVQEQKAAQKEKSPEEAALELYKLAIKQAYPDNFKERDIEGAKESLKQAITTINSSEKQNSRLLSAFTCQLASIYDMDFKNYSEVEKLYLKGINIAKTNEKENYRVLVDCYNGLAIFYEIHNKLASKEIEKYFNMPVKLIEKYEPENIILKDRYYSNLAGFYKDIDPDRSEKIYFELISHNDKKRLLNYINGLIRLYRAEKNNIKAEELLAKYSNTLASEDFISNYIKYYDNITIYEAYSFFSKVYKIKKDYKKAEIFENIALKHNPRNGKIRGEK